MNGYGFEKDASGATIRVTVHEPDIYDEIDERNGWTDDDPTAEEDQPKEVMAPLFEGKSISFLKKELAELARLREQEKREAGSEKLLTDVMRFITAKGRLDTEKGMKILGIRSVAAIYVVARHLLQTKDSKPAVLEDIAKGTGRTRCWISMVAEEFSNEFKYFSASQKSQKSRPRYAQSAKKGWEKRRKKKKDPK